MPLGGRMKKRGKKPSHEGICQLCGCQGKLCEAHIVPKALKHLVAGRGGTFAALKILPTGESSFTSKAITAYKEENLDFDKDILCADCDRDILGPYDEILVDFYKKYIQLSNTHIFVKNIHIETDKKLYFGFLTTLYRASITKRKQAVHLPEKYKELIKLSLFDGTLEYLSDDLRIYLRGHRRDFSSHSICNMYGRDFKEGQYLYCFPSFGLEVIFLFGNIGRTKLSNELNSRCVCGETTLLDPNQGHVNIHLSHSPSQLTQILLSVELPLPLMVKKIRK